MSKSVDERVVSMQFDNRNFENNVKTSMNTLDKLKQSLKLTEASKGLENVSSTAKKFDITPMGNGVESVKMKFSALEVMAVTALANITNSAMNAGKRIVSAFTIDPIKSGFQEYETQINAVQTILANTSSKGTTIDQVNAALDELNTYADKTIYNFTEMTRNIGTFTAAGVDLDTSVNAIQGIANLAAVSGSTSQQASTAMYQLSQALAAGTVKLMDWNSVVNAGMGGEVFQNALKKTSALLGTGAEAAIEANGSFRESLQTGWLTSEVLTETLKKFTTSGANEYVAEYCGVSAEAVQSALEAAEAQYGEAEAIDKAAQALADKTGKNKDEIKSALEMAKTAQDAATKVKTFSQLFDTLKEAVQSGWTQTWEILIGDFEESKELFTKLSDFFGGIINNISNARNRILEGAMGSPLGQLAEKVSKFTKAAGEATDTVKDLGSVVDDVINGKFGNGQKRWDALTEAGYNWAEVQNAVNEKLGSSFRHVVELTDAQKKQTGQVEELTDAKLKEYDLTEQEIKMYRKLEEQSKKTGKSISELISADKSMTGRELLIGSFENIGKGLITIFKSVGQAWKDIFGTSDEEKIQKIYGGLQSLYDVTSKFANKFKENGAEAEKLRKTFEGLFAAIDLVRMVVGGGLSIVFKVLKTILSYFNMDILDLTSFVGEAIVKFRNWIKEHDLLSKTISFVIPYIVKAAKAISDWVKNSEELQKAKDVISDFVTDSKKAIKDWIQEFKNIDNIPKYIIDGLKKGLTKGIPKIIEAGIEFAKNLYDSVCEFLGIESPSKKFIEIGKYVIEGLVKGIQNGLSAIKEKASEIASSLTEAFEKIDFGKVFASITGAGILVIGYKLSSAFESIGSAVEDLGGVLEGAESFLTNSGKGIKKALSGLSLELKSKALVNLAVSIGILAAALIALTFVDQNKLDAAVWVIIKLAGVLAVLAIAVSKMSDSSMKIGKDGINVKSVIPNILAIAGSLLILAGAVKILSSIKDIKSGFLRLIGVIAAMSVFILALVGISKIPGASEDIEYVGSMMIKLSIAMGLMVLVMKRASKLKDKEIKQAAKFMLSFSVFVVALSLASRIGRDSINKVGSMMIKIAFSMALLVGVMKLISKLKQTEIDKGVDFMKSFSVFVLALSVASRIAGKNSSKIGSMMIGISGSMLIMSYVVKILGDLEPEALLKGLVCVGLFAKMIGLLIAAVGLFGKDATKIGGTILAMSIAIGILAGVSILLGMVELTSLAKGVIAVGFLSLIMDGMIIATKNAKDVKGSIIAMSVAIGIMAASVAALSFIDEKKLLPAVVAMDTLMALFSLMEYTAKNAKDSMGSIIAMDVAIALIAGSIFLLSKIDSKSALLSATAMSVVLLSLSGALFIIGESKIDKNTILGLTVMSVAIGVIGGILYLLSGLPTSKAAVSIALVSAAILALSGAMYLISKTNITATTVVTLGIMAATVVILGGIMSMLSSMDVGGIVNIAAGLGMLVVTLAAITIAVNAMNGCLAGAAALVVVSLALSVFIPVMIQLCSLNLSQVGIGLLALAGAFAVLGVAGLLLGPVAPVLLVLGAAITLIGVGSMTAGLGLLTFAQGLSLLVQTGSAGLQILNQAIMFFIQLIPMMILKIGEGILSLIVFIGQSAPQIATAIIQVVSSILITLQTLIPQFVSFVVTTIETILVTLAEHMPTIIQAGIDILMALLNGIKNNIGNVVTTVADIVINFLNALGEKMPDIIQAGIDFIFNFIEGLGQGIENNAEKLRETIVGLCKHIWNAFKEFFGINSPSKKMEEAGGFLLAGLKNGLSVIGGVVGKVKELGKKLVSTIKEKASSWLAKGKELAGKLKDGIGSKASDIKKKVSDVVSKAGNAIKEKKAKFKEFGGNLMSGLKEGIANAKDKVVSKAKEVAGNISEAVKGFFGINSPSKLFSEYGRYLDEGLIVGMGKYASKVNEAAKGIGQKAVNGISNAISGIGDIVDSDVDIQPTIRPVIDMNSVQTERIKLGADISSFLTRPVDSMSSLINKAQEEINASNNKVIESINGLREDLAEFYSSDGQELALYVDSRKLASSIAKPMNQQLNILSKRGSY